MSKILIEDVYGAFHPKARATFYARSESIKAHFISHVDYLEANVFDLEVDEAAKKEAKKYLSTNKKKAEEEGYERLRKDHALYRYFGFLEGEGWKPLDAKTLNDKNVVSDQLLKKMAKLDQKEARNILSVYESNKADIEIEDKKYPEMKLALQYELYERMNDLMGVGFPDNCWTFLDWLASDETELYFHIENTVESERFKTFLKKNRVRLGRDFNLRTAEVRPFVDDEVREDEEEEKHDDKNVPLVGGSKSWHESPQHIVKKLAEKLFLTLRQEKKESGISAVTKRLCKEYGIKYAKRTNEAKREVYESFKQKKWKNLSTLEKEYAIKLGEYYVIEKRSIVLREVFEVISNIRRFKEFEELNVANNKKYSQQGDFF